jgi:hypothetical protein
VTPLRTAVALGPFASRGAKSSVVYPALSDVPAIILHDPVSKCSTCSPELAIDNPLLFSIPPDFRNHLLSHWYYAMIRRAEAVEQLGKAFEGFYEDLARQNIVARLFQRQLGFRRRHTWVSVIVVAS